jgi:hypothetical protein
MHAKHFIATTAVVGLTAAAATAATNALELVSAELRYGVGDAYSGEGFHSAVAATDFSLPWEWRIGSSWQIIPRLDLAAGWMGKSGTDATTISLGPMFAIGPRNYPLTFDVGVSPTLVSESVFGSKNIGGRFQFTDTIGLTLTLSPKASVGYHFVHLSNAGIYERNPGINFHTVAVGYHF